MQQHGVNPRVQVSFFFFFFFRYSLSYMNLTRIQMQYSINYRENVRLPRPECDSLLREVIINAFLYSNIALRRGGGGWRLSPHKFSLEISANTVWQASISPATNRWFEGKPGSWFQLEKRRNSWIRAIICFNGRSRLTVLDWIVKEAQHFLNLKTERGTIKLNFWLKLSDNLTFRIDLRDFLYEDRLCTFSLGPA